MVTERFGILRHRHPIVFAGGSITPLDDIEDTLTDVAAVTHPDGHCYPPTQVTVVQGRREGIDTEEEVPRSRRPALLHSLPATHVVTVDAPLDTDFKRGDGGFLIHLAAYLFGTRVQFEEWDIDGRVPVDAETHAVHVTPKQASSFFTTGYDTWRLWPHKSRQAFTTALYLHSKAPAYEWLWESFLVEYMAFDALWKLSGQPNLGHRARIRQMCDRFGLPFDDTIAQEIVALRNDLVHEGLWEGDAPGFRVTQHGWQCTRRIRMLNQRIVAASLGWTGEYVRASWIHSSWYHFFR